MKFLATLSVSAALALATLPVAASCTSFGNTTNCYDARSGNRYSIQQHGDTTTMRGSNSRTGSRWSQQSNTVGGTTYHRGRDSNGNAWRGQTNHYDQGNGNLTGRGISNCGIAGCD